MPHPSRPRALRAAIVASIAAAALLGAATPAFAHVTAQPGTAEAGGYTVINIHVPNESGTAGTVKLEITLPPEHPIGDVSTTPVPGWTARLVKATLAQPIKNEGSNITEAVRTVTWTANPGTRIGPDEFLEFSVSLGPLPTDTDQLVIPAVQTYDNGDVVAWNQPPAADGSEPERPAPTVTLSRTPADAKAGTTSGTDTTARWLGGAGLLLGALGLGLGVGAVLRLRRTTGSD